MLKNIRVVLIQTSHPGNIGACARAMQTMGLEQLYLVQPKSFPHEQATAMAAGADAILTNAVITSNIMTALQGCQFVLGTSLRERGIELPYLDARECGKTVISESQHHKIALLFGRESTGLSNEELALCHARVHIPTIGPQHSLNLAAAVQVIAYEIYTAWLHTQSLPEKQQPYGMLAPASVDQMEHFYQRLEELLLGAQFISHEHPNRIMPRLRRLFNRARPDNVELNILQGIVTALK